MAARVNRTVQQKPNLLLRAAVLLVSVSLLLTGCSGSNRKKLNVIDDNYRTYYEVFLYSFYDSDGDGIGDIQGLIEKLDYINDGDPETDSDLGLNGIWLMPIMPSPTYHKYDVADYCDIDPQYGTLDDFKELVAACDERGIKLIIDLPLNHTSTEHEWFQSAVKSLAIPDCGQEVCTEADLCVKHNPYCTYYNFVQGAPETSGYYKTGAGDWYYEGKFWSGMPDLNLGDANLRTDIEEVMQFWLDLGVGGFRLDAAKEFYSGSTDKNIEVLSWINDYVKADSPDNYLVAEAWEPFNIYSKYYASGIDSLFDFAFADTNGKITKTLNYTGSGNSARSFAEAMVQAQDTFRSYNADAIDAPFFTNHDVGRAAGYFQQDADKIKVAGAMNLLMSGNVFVYYGEELGMSGSGIDENKRAPMLWSNDEDTGMTVGPPNMEEVHSSFDALDKQQKDKTSIYNYYKEAIRLRNVFPEIARGTVAVIDEVEDEDICAVTKTWNDSKLIFLYNLSEETKTVTLSPSEYGYKELAGNLQVGEEQVTLKDDTITLPPYGIAVLQ